MLVRAGPLFGDNMPKTGATGDWQSGGATGSWENDPNTWHPLVSSNVAAYRYDHNSHILYVRFTSGREYSFSGVPQEVADGLGSAQSPGHYFHTAIKNQYQQAWKFKK